MYQQIPKYSNLYRIFDARIYKIEFVNFHNHNTLKEYFRLKYEEIFI